MWPLLALRVADRFGKGLRGAPRDALIAESTPPAVRGRAFGLHRALDTLGAAIAPVAAWLILRAWPGQYRAVFWATLLPGAAAVLLLFLRETAPARPPAGAGPHPGCAGFCSSAPSSPWGTPPTPSG